MYDADDAEHVRVKAVVEAEPGPLPLILVAEIDYLLLTRRLGIAAALDFLDSVQRGAFALVMPSTDDLRPCREVMAQYRDLTMSASRMRRSWRPRSAYAFNGY